MLRYEPYEQTNPRAHAHGPFALRYAAGRPEGLYPSVDSAVVIANNNGRGACSVVTSSGWWIIGRIVEDVS